MGGKELLAPAGDLEAGYAALYYGADAVYLGLQQFSGIYLGLEPIVSILQSDRNPGFGVVFRGTGQPCGNRLLLALSHCQVSIRAKVYKGKVAHIQRNIFHYYPCMLVNARAAA